MTGPAKPILDIQLNAESFEAFQRKYAAYQAELEKMPERWREAANATKDNAEAAEQLNTFMERHLEAMQEVDKKQADEREGAEKLGVSWSAVTHYARSFHSNVQGATQSLAKWMGLTAVFSGILGAGGLFGISRLDMAATGRRANAAAEGNSYGEQQSFSASFGRLGGAANLDWMNSLLSDPREFWKLETITGSAGSAQQIQGEDSAKAFADILPQLKSLVDRFPKGQFDTAAQTYGLPQDLARILSSMSPDEVRQMVQSYRSNVNPLNLSPDVLRKWNDLNVTVDLAGGKIDPAFRDKLVLLTPGLEKFITAIGDIIDYALRDGGQIDKWLKGAGSGLGSIANSMDSKSFNASVDAFVRNLELITSTIDSLVTTNLLDTLESRWWHEGLGGKIAVGGVEAVRAAGRVVAGAVEAGAEVIQEASDASKKREAETGVPGYISNPAVISGAIVKRAIDTWHAAAATVDFLGKVFGPAPGNTPAPIGSAPDKVPETYGPFPKNTVNPRSLQLDRYLSPNTNPLTSFAPGSSSDSDIKGMHPNAQQRARESATPQVTIDVPYGQMVTAQ